MIKPFVKYCGNKSLQDYIVSCSSQADYIGFVFAESKRQVKIKEVASWVQEVNRYQKKLVGIFVNQSIEEIVEATETISLSVIQLHGEETPAFIKELKTKTRTETQIWKVIHHENHYDKSKMQAYRGIVDGYVIDKKVGKMYGGTGHVFDWSYLPTYLKQAKEEKVPCFVAGGINESNLSELLAYHPDGIDISSGIEQDFRKNKEKINALESKVNDYGTNKSTNTHANTR